MALAKRVWPAYRGQHEHTLLHLSQAESGDTEHLAFVGHEVGEQHDVTHVYTHTVRYHCVRDLIHYCRSKSKCKITKYSIPVALYCRIGFDSDANVSLSFKPIEKSIAIPQMGRQLPYKL